MHTFSAGGVTARLFPRTTALGAHTHEEMPTHGAALELCDEHVLPSVLSLSLCINPVGKNVKS